LDGFRLYEKIKKLDDNVVICFLTAADNVYYKILKKHYPRVNENCVIHKPVDKNNKISIVNLQSQINECLNISLKLSGKMIFKDNKVSDVITI